MKVGLFIPCYVDQFYPNVAIATLQLLEKHGCDVSFPLDQTCCGQPMANAGFASLTTGCNKNFIHNFSGFLCIVIILFLLTWIGKSKSIGEVFPALPDRQIQQSWKD